MSLVINHNMMAMNAARNLGIIYDRLSRSTQRLSSGLRINSAGDDAAGLAIRELMRADILVINQGVRNAYDGISMIQTAEGAMAVIDEKLIRMKELAEQAATGTYTTAQRLIMNSEYQAMAAEIDRIANATDFNGTKLLDGSISAIHEGSGLKIHFGTGNDEAEDYYFVQIGDTRATSQTGLRVGGEGDQEILTNGTNFESLSSIVTSANNTSYLGFWYNVNGESTIGQSSATAYDNPENLVGIFHAVSGGTLQDLIDEINQGTAARVRLTFGSSAASAIVSTADASSGSSSAQTVRIGNTDVLFYGQCASGIARDFEWDTYDNSGLVLSTAFASAFNTYTSADTFAVALDDGVGTDVYFFAKQAGADGNLLQYEEVTAETDGDYYFYDLDAGTSATSGYFSMGGRGWIEAGAEYDGRDWQLTVTGAGLAEDFDVYIRNAGAILASATTWATDLTGFTDDEWVETQNASGTNRWDGLHIRTQSAAQEALNALDDAILRKDIVRANLGAFQNRLENTITQLGIQAENLQAAESRISDVDVATEMTEFTRNNIMAQAATSMLAQANSLNQLALTLLQG